MSTIRGKSPKQGLTIAKNPTISKCFIVNYFTTIIHIVCYSIAYVHLLSSSYYVICICTMRIDSLMDKYNDINTII